MKSIIFSGVAGIAFLFFSNTALAQPVTETVAKMEFAKETHDYGIVKYGADGTCTFTFKNTGNAPLIISKAEGSCGCTVPDWPKAPIAPGQSAEIKVKYNTTKTGPFSKSVKLFTNAGSEPKMLYIKGTVASEPVNTSPVDNSGPRQH